MSTSASDELPTVELQLPAGVHVASEGAIITVRGPLGSVAKDLAKVPVRITVGEGKVSITAYGKKRSAIAITHTARSLIRNMVAGVTKGFTYKLKVVYAHFPISVKVKGEEVLVENFYGERSPRIAKIVGDCKLTIQGDDVIVQGPSLEDVGQTAANIEQATRVRRKDQRVFLDGIYVYEKRR